MKIIWITPLLLLQSYRTIGSQLQEEYDQYSFYQRRPLSPRPLDAMADLTNDLGVCVLRIIAAGGAIGNIAFSPFGLMAVSVLLYEGSSGYSALQIKQSLNLPWEILAVRVGVRDLNRYLKTYFKSDGFLNGLTMSREEVCLRPQFKRVLRLYSFDDPNNFLVDSCPESIASTTQQLQPISVTTHGTVVTEIIPTSQSIQVSTNITNETASDTSTVATDVPAKVTLVSDTTFTISNVDTNTNQPANSQADMMIIDIETQPQTRPIESSTNLVETTILNNDQELKSSNEVEVTNLKPNELISTDKILESTTSITSNDPMMALATVTQTMTMDYSNNTMKSQTNMIIDATTDSESFTNPTEMSTSQSNKNNIINDTSYASSLNVFDVNAETTLPNNLYVTSLKNKPNITVGSTESIGEKNTIDDKYVFTENIKKDMTSTTNEFMIDLGKTEKTKIMDDGSTFVITPSTKSMSNIIDVTTAIETNSIPIKVTDQTTPSINSELVNNDLTTNSANIIFTMANTNDEKNTMNGKYVFTENIEDGITSTTSEFMTDPNKTERTKIMDDGNTLVIIPSTKSMSDVNDVTTTFETNSIPIKVTDQTTPSINSELNNNDVTTNSANLISTTEVFSTVLDSRKVTENEILKEAESNQHYQIASIDKKSARSIEPNDSLPTFNVEFVVRKEDFQTDCNQTRKKTVIKPNRILTEYPTNSGISITLRESKKRRRRHLEQYQRYSINRFNGYKNYGPPTGWIDRSSDPYEPVNLFNAGYQHIPSFTYTAVLPFGFIFELKSQVIEIPLDDPKYTLMILMPNQPDGLSELLLLLPTMSLRKIHNSLKPTAVHATIPTFKYTAKVDLTSALQQIGIRDVFYRYRADLSFMSPDARLFVSSVQQVVSVTAKKYNTPPVYEIQRKYVEHDFVLSRPFAYFVMDIHTKVSLIAGVITDPLASPIWI